MKYTADYLEDLAKAAANIPDIDAIKGKSVLITGACGMICSAVADMLMTLNDNNGCNTGIYLAARSEKKTSLRYGERMSRSDVHYVEYDATRPFNTDIPFDYIIHGASNADPKAIMSKPVETMTANIYGTQSLLEYTVSHSKCRLLYISSSEVYGRKQSEQPYTEDEYGYVDILNPRSCYPTSKRAAETLCASFRKEHGTDAVIVRPGHVYGPTMTETDSRASSQFPRDIVSGSDIVMKSKGSQLRSYCYMTDCASAILSVLVAGVSGEAYNISNRNSVVTIRQMAEAFAKAGGRKVVFDIPSSAELAGYNMMDNSSLDATKLERLGWKAETGMEEGAAKTLAQLT